MKAFDYKKLKIGLGLKNLDKNMMKFDECVPKKMQISVKRVWKKTNFIKGLQRKCKFPSKDRRRNSNFTKESRENTNFT